VRASKRKKRASIKEREEPKLDSVLDFLYYDNRRVALLIAQFDDFGLLQQIERPETTAESATDKARMSANIGPRSLSLQTGIDRGTKETGTDSSKRVYDPFWVIPLSFRDYLEERGLLRNNLNTARIGQIVVVRGRLTILDMGLLKSLWRIPEAKENAMQSALLRQTSSELLICFFRLPTLFRMASNAYSARQILTKFGHFFGTSISRDRRLIWL
jgi:hypothetical protein